MGKQSLAKEYGEEVSSSDSGSDSNSEGEVEPNQPQVFKPVFVPKSKRLTIQEQEEIQRKEELLVVQNQLREEARKKKTRELVAESIRKSEVSACR